MTTKTNKILARAALALLGLIAMGLVVRGILNYSAGKRLESAIREMKAAGKRLSVEEFEPKCRDIDNAGLIWKSIETMFVKDFDAPQVVSSPLKTLSEGKPLEPSVRARIEEESKKYESIFLLMREAAQKPCFKYARRWKNVSFSLRYINMRKLTPLFRLYLLNASLRAEKGEYGQSVQDFLAALQNMLFFLHEPHPFNRFYTWELLAEHLEVLRSVLSQGSQDERTCRSVMEKLGGLHPRESLRLSFQLEKAMALEEFMPTLRGQVRGSPAEKTWLWLFKPRLKSEALFCLKLWESADRALNEPYYGDKKWINQYLDEMKKIPRSFQWARIFYSSFGPWILTKHARLEAMIDITRTALACRIYRSRHERLPENLIALAPEILSEIPVDPFTGRPFVYRRTPKGFMLYSLGPNQKDDGGSGAWGYKIKEGDDIAWIEE